jgi:hypothetical protein
MGNNVPEGGHAAACEPHEMFFFPTGRERFKLMVVLSSDHLPSRGQAGMLFAEFDNFPVHWP